MGKKKNFLFGAGMLAVVLLMFTFAYANVPLFKLFCQRFGLGGQGKAGSESTVVPSSACSHAPARCHPSSPRSPDLVRFVLILLIRLYRATLSSLSVARW